MYGSICLHLRRLPCVLQTCLIPYAFPVILCLLVMHYIVCFLLPCKGGASESSLLFFLRLTPNDPVFFVKAHALAWFLQESLVNRFLLPVSEILICVITACVPTIFRPSLHRRSRPAARTMHRRQPRSSNSVLGYCRDLPA